MLAPARIVLLIVADALERTAGGPATGWRARPTLVYWLTRVSRGGMPHKLGVRWLV
jgi:hypothetical protein